MPPPFDTNSESHKGKNSTEKKCSCNSEKLEDTTQYTHTHTNAHEIGTEQNVCVQWINVQKIVD